MGDVVNISEPEPLIWVCDCGCSTFNLFSDGTARCSVCAGPVTGAVDGWQDDTLSAARREPPVQASADQHGNGSVGFTRALAKRRADAADAVLIISAAEDSRVSVWTAAETDEQIDWMLRRLEDAGVVLEKLR